MKREWPDTYINVFLSSRDRTPNTESVHFELNDCYQSILDGQAGAQYAYTLHVFHHEGERTPSIEHLEDDARAWEAEGDRTPAFSGRTV